MAIVVEKEFVHAVHQIHNLVEDKVLCSSNKEKGVIESKIPLYVSNIVSAYLILAFTRLSNADIVKWKISFNDVILTRELKPHIEFSINNKYIQSVFVYDVSRIVPRNESSIKISCTAKGYVYLDGVTLLTIAQYKGFHTHIKCEVNPYIIDDSISRSYNLTPSFDANEAIIHLGLIATSPSWIEIKTSYGDIKKINLLKGYNVIESKLNKNSLSSIQISSGSPQTRHIFSCAALQYAEYPSITIEDLKIIGSVIKLKLKNVGNSVNDTLELMVLRYGIPIYKVSLPQLKPNEHIDYEIDLNSIVKQGGFKANNIVFRIIWSKAYKLFERDIPLNSQLIL